MKESANIKSYKIAREILKIYAYSDLSSEMQREVQNWLLSDFHTEEKEAALWNMWNNLPAIPKSEVRQAWRDVKNKTGIKNTPILYLNRKRYIQAAAVFVPLLLFAGILYMNFKGHIEMSDEIGNIEKLIFISGDIQKTLVLPDDTEVQLNKESELIYNENRLVELKGEAFFNVKNKEDQNFTVQTEHMKVTVTGTRFNMLVHPDSLECLVSLYEGNLEVEIEDVAIFMTAGQELVYNTQLNKFSTESISKSTPDWNRHYIFYNEIELQKIFKDLETRYSVEIKGGNPIVLKDTITLKLEGSSDIKEIMLLLREINGKFDYTIEDNTIYIY